MGQSQDDRAASRTSAPDAVWLRGVTSAPNNRYVRERGLTMLAGQKVLLTGVTGRIGEAIAARFARSCELWGLARYSTEGSIEKTRERGVVPVIGDYATGELSQVPTDFDYVVHVAADVAPPSAEAGMRANSD